MPMVSAQTGLSLSHIHTRVLAGMFMLVLGFTLVGGIGFANDLAVHNGAHDTRHAMGFPCH